MADIHPDLSRPLCCAVSAALSAEAGRPLGCRDVSRAQWGWDLELFDQSDGSFYARISHVRDVWQECLVAEGETEHIREVLEGRLAHREDVLVRINTHDNRENKTHRRQFAAMLADYVLLALENAADGEDVDVLKVMEAGEVPRWLELRCALNTFQVVQGLVNGGPHIMIQSDQMVRFQPSATAGVLERVKAKERKQEKLAGELCLLVEVDGASLTHEDVLELRRELVSRPSCFAGVLVCTRDFGRAYRVHRVA